MVTVQGNYLCPDGVTHTQQFIRDDGQCPQVSIIGGQICDLVAGSCTIVGSNVKGCFIATAAYGNELAPPVQFLRNFRDDIVLKSSFGKIFNAFLNVYYRFSPTIANAMRKNKPLKYTMKYLVVWPFVGCAIVCAYITKLYLKRKH
jgi:hypothetical protein